MNNFEELIAPYVNKIIHKDNPEIVKFELKRKPKCMTIDLKEVNKIQRVRTPNGSFSTIRAAARAMDLSDIHIRKLCDIKGSGYTYDAKGEFYDN